MNPVTRFGDLWQLGRHLLLCGDARAPEVYSRLLGNALADMVFTGPPYNVAIEGHVSGLGRVKHAEFAMASGEMTESEFIIFLQKSLGAMAQVCRDGAIAYVCMAGAIWASCSLLAVRRSANSRICVSGTRPMGAWGRSTAPSMSWCSSGRSAPQACIGLVLGCDTERQVYADAVGKRAWRQVAPTAALQADQAVAFHRLERSRQI